MMPGLQGVPQLPGNQLGQLPYILVPYSALHGGAPPVAGARVSGFVGASQARRPPQRSVGLPHA